MEKEELPKNLLEEESSSKGVPPNLLFLPVPIQSRKFAIPLLIFILVIFIVAVVLAFSGVFGHW